MFYGCPGGKIKGWKEGNVNRFPYYFGKDVWYFILLESGHISFLLLAYVVLFLLLSFYVPGGFSRACF
jgi:hypothetical protein